jgi:hypothetical protein
MVLWLVDKYILLGYCDMDGRDLAEAVASPYTNNNHFQSILSNTLHEVTKIDVYADQIRNKSFDCYVLRNAVSGRSFLFCAITIFC